MIVARDLKHVALAVGARAWIESAHIGEPGRENSPKDFADARGALTASLLLRRGREWVGGVLMS